MSTEIKAGHTLDEHRHGTADCSHETMQHGDHTDYLHDGHRHAEHEDHYDEHRGERQDGLEPLRIERAVLDSSHILQGRGLWIARRRQADRWADAEHRTGEVFGQGVVLTRDGSPLFHPSPECPQVSGSFDATQPH